LASEEEAEAAIFEGHFETVAEEAQSLLESESLAPIVAGLHSISSKSQSSIDIKPDPENDGLVETLKSIEYEEAEIDEALNTAEEMDHWKPQGVERRRGQDLPTPFLVRKKKVPVKQLETEVSEFEEHERRLEQLSNRIDRILAPLAPNEQLDDEEDLLRVGAFAPLAKGESLHSLSSASPSREEERGSGSSREGEGGRGARWPFCPRWWCPWSRPSSSAFSWFPLFRFFAAAT